MYISANIIIPIVFPSMNECCFMIIKWFTRDGSSFSVIITLDIYNVKKIQFMELASITKSHFKDFFGEQNIPS